MGLGFRQAASAGISLGKDDLIIPAEKGEPIASTQAEVKELEQQYQDGLITAGERDNKAVDAWSRRTDVARPRCARYLQAGAGPADRRGVDDVATPARAARPRKMRELDGMRGQTAKLFGQIIEQLDHRRTPRKVLSGSRILQLDARAPEGLADTALKDAQTRRPYARGGRGAGLHHRRGRLRRRARPDRARGDGRRRGRVQRCPNAPWAAPRPRTCSIPVDRRGAGAEQHADRGRRRPSCIEQAGRRER